MTGHESRVPRAIVTPDPTNPEFRFDASISSAVEAAELPTQPEDTTPSGPLDEQLLDRMHRYWSAANYLTVGQIYLQENPLLREPLEQGHIKPRLLGHW